MWWSARCLFGRGGGALQSGHDDRVLSWRAMSAPLTGLAACRASWSTTTWAAREGGGRGGAPVTDRRTGDPDRRARGRAPQRWPTTPASAHDHDEGGVGRRAVALPA